MPSEGGVTIYRANDHFYGGEWYDWALVEDPEREGVTFVGKILGFVQYLTPNFPTYRRKTLDKLNAVNIEMMTQPDDTIYVGVHASSTDISREQLSASMAMKFSLETPDKIYFYPITCIKMPLIVVRDFGSESKLDHVHVLSQDKWPGVFRAYIKSIEWED